MADTRTRARQEPAAIVGLGCIFPGAPTAEAFWHNICAGVDSLSDVPPDRWDPVYYDPSKTESPAGERFYCRRGGFVDDIAAFDPTAFGIMPVTVAAGEPDQFLALSQAAAALADCGNAHDRTPSDRVGVIVGRGSYQTPGIARLAQRVATAQQLVETLHALLPDVEEARLQQVRDEFLAKLGPDHPEAAIGLVPNLVASRIANRLDLQGPAYTVDAACASALVAVDHGVRDLASRRCDLVLAGGVHHCHDVTLWSVFTRLGALSRSSQIRPFSQQADGTVVGEGSGFVVLKRLADAERDGDRIYAVVRGTGVASDGRARSLMNPDAAGQVLATERAWAAAGLNPATIGLVEAHGSGTPVGDEVELEGLRQVFGKAKGEDARAGLGSVKSMVGHTMPAAGIAGLIKATLALHDGVRPPTLHADDPHPLLADTRFRLVRELEPWAAPEGPRPTPRRAAVSAFGFGGINAHVVLEEHAGSLPTPHRWPAATALVASTKAESLTSADAGQHESASAPRTLLLAGDDAADIARQLRGFNESNTPGTSAQPEGGPARLAVIGLSARRLELARRVVEQGEPWRGRDGVWFEPRGLLRDGGKLALLFPGVEPTFEPRIDDVARHFGLENLVEPLLDVPAHEAASGLHHQARGIIAVGRLFHRVLRELGVAGDMLAGHSIGEWTGELAAGVIAEDDFDALVAHLAPGSVQMADLGFLATGCGVDRARELAAGLGRTAVSHDNCPHQTVVCGPTDELAIVAGRCRERRILAQELPFRSGFHSPLLQQHLPAITKTLGSLRMQAPRVPLWSATTCQPYPDDPDAIRDLATRHLVEPVRFRELIMALHAAGTRVFVQMGPGGLCGFVDDTLRGRDAVALAANSPRRPGLQQLGTVSVALWAQGHDVALDRLGFAARPEQSRRPGAALNSSDSAVRLDLGTRLVRDFTPLEPSVPAGDRPLTTLSRPTETRAQATTAQQNNYLEAPSQAGAQATAALPDERMSERIFALVDEPTWADHALFRQADDWPHPEDRFPLVPMTGMVEVLMAAARELRPGLVPIAVEDVMAYRWLTVEPPTTATVRAAVVPSEEPTVRVKAAIDGHALATVVLAPGYPAAPPAPEVPLANERPSPLSATDFYQDRHMFHGPAYQGVSDLLSVADNGSRARLTARAAPGALLDAAGQLMGHWLVARASDAGDGRAEHDGPGPLVLPTAIERIDLYGPFPACGTELDCTLLVTGVDSSALRCDLTLTLGGRVWGRVTGWQDRCFPTDEAMFRTFQWPEHSAMSTPLTGNVALVRERWLDSATRDLVMRRYLGRDERTQYQALNPLDQRRVLLERIAVKDTVRGWLWSRDDPDASRTAVFPAEVVVTEDFPGRYQAQGPFSADLQVSLAQVDDLAVAVAVAGESPHLGVDIERIEPRRANFEEVALTAGERGLHPPEGFDRDTWLTCLWAVKEAAAKASGGGLRGHPQAVEILEHADNVARVGPHRIAFRRLAATEHDPSGSSPNHKEYIVAWSITD